MKKKLSMKKLLVAAMMLLMIGVGNVAKADMILQTNDGTFSFGIGTDHHAHINGFCSGATIPQNLVIPATLSHGDEAYYVVEICENAFQGNTTITSLTFAEGSQLDSIGNNAFQGCSNLTGNLSFPATLTLIGNNAFDGCYVSPNSGNLTIPSSLEMIGNRAFYNCSFQNVYYNAIDCSSNYTNSVLQLLQKGDVNQNRDEEEQIGAFVGCSGTLTIGSSVETIGYNMFNAAAFTGDITIPSNVKLLYNHAFSNLSSVPHVYFNANRCERDRGLLQGVLSLLGKNEEEKPTRMTVNRGQGVFDGCTATLTIGDNVQSIGEYLFEFGSFTGELIIPSNITKINTGVFKDCDGFTKLTLHDGITYIGDYAFAGFGDADHNDELQLTFPPLINVVNVATYKDSNFKGALNIPEAITKIDNGAFMGCQYLTSLNLNKVAYIGDAAFANCNSMAGTLTIPKTLKHMGIAAFSTSPDESFDGIWAAESEIRDPDMAEEMTNFTKSGDMTISERMKINIHELYNSLPTSENSCGAFTTLVFEAGCPLLPEIPARAFWGRCGLTSTDTWPTLPSAITSIGVCAFAGCYNLNGCLTLPATVETIGERAFALCSGMNCINWSDSIEYIGSQAFMKTSLPADALAVLPTALDELYGNAFDTTAWFNSYGGTDYNGVIYLDKWVMGYKGTHAEDYVLAISNTANGKDIKRIAIEAFAKRTDFKSGLSLPEGIIHIGESAFAGCTSMTGTITIPSTVKTIGPAAFSNIVYTSVKLYEETSQSVLDLLQKGDEKLSGGSSNRFMQFTALVFDGGSESQLETISNYAFKDCQNITGNLAIPNTVTSIGEGAFMNCEELDGTLTLPSGITKIGPRTFYHCEKLTGTVSIPSTVKEIGGESFYNCSSIKTLVLESSKSASTLKRIGKSAFENCSSIGIESTEPRYTQVIPNSVTYIGDRAFYGCSNICNFVIGNNVEYIGTNAFANTCWENKNDILYLNNWCIGLKEGNDGPVQLIPLNIADKNPDDNSTSITRIANNAFNGKCETSMVTIPNTVKYIGDYAFAGIYAPSSGDANPVNISIPKSVGWIGSYAFHNTYLNLGFAEGSALKTIDDNAFNGCEFYTPSLTLPYGLERIGERAFGGSNITSLNIPSSVFIVGYDILNSTPWYESQQDGLLYVDGCCLGHKGKLDTETLNLRTDTRLIAAGAFSRCYNLTTIKIPSSLQFIGDDAFSDCHGLSGDLVLSNTVKLIGKNAFAGCTGFYGEDLLLDMNNMAITMSTYGDFDNFDGYYIAENAFFDCGFNNVFYVDRDAVAAHSDAFDEFTYKNSIFYYPKGEEHFYQPYLDRFTNTVGARYFTDSNATWGADATVDDDHIVVIGNYNMTASKHINELYIFRGGRFIVNENQTLTVDGKLTNRGEQILSSIWYDNFQIKDGAQLVNKTKGVRGGFEKAIHLSTAKGDIYWQFLASPILGENRSMSLATLGSNDNLGLFRFNQAPAGPDYLEWEDATAHDFGFENGRGYLLATTQFPYLVINGEFHLENDTDNNDNDLGYAAIPLVYDATIIDNPQTPFVGWNLVGNPFPSDAYIDKSYYVIVDGEAIQETPITDLNSPIPSCTGVFVVAQGQGESVRFSRTAPAPQSTNLGYLNISLLNGEAMRGSKKVDHATISFNDGDELLKLNFLTGDAKIYIPQGEKQYAIAVAEQEGELPLNFEAYKNGRFTIDITPDRAKLGYLHLIDNMTGANIDLLQTSSYSFEATTRDYASRFRIVFSDKAIAGDADGDNTFAYFNGSEWIIANDEEATLQVVDMMGRVLVSRDVINRFSTSNLAPGVYVLRLVNGENVKVQKVVIK